MNKERVEGKNGNDKINITNYFADSVTLLIYLVPARGFLHSETYNFRVAESNPGFERLDPSPIFSKDRIRIQIWIEYETPYPSPNFF